MLYRSLLNRCLGGLLLVVLLAGYAPAEDGKRIVFLAGRPSHGYGSHEHLAGCRFLAESITKAVPGVRCDVIPGGWPEDSQVLEGADAIVMYADGGGGHPALNHLKELDKHMQRGAGFVCIHYAVEVPKERGGPEFLNWLGGYFETHWSVNPHWNAEFKTLPEHPVTRGVKPFTANDEWYFHMRFRPGMEGVTPILSAVAPPETMSRPDGAHSGNPAVREAVAKGIPQHTAWVFERPDGGRSFGFTGGHFHWNWGRPEILQLVTNAIAWTAKVEIPEGGLRPSTPDIEALKEGQDEAAPERFDSESIRRDFKLSSTRTQARGARSASDDRARLLFTSPRITSQTPGHRVNTEIDVRGVKQLYLVVTDAGDGFACDWADWVEPVLTKSGAKQSLTELKWTRADAQWGQVGINRNANGGPLSVAGKPVANGIGTHANSVIAYQLDGSWEKLNVGCALDTGGTEQNGGKASSVTFLVYADALPRNLPSGGPAGASDSDRAAENAVAGLTVAPGVEATLAASEPDLLSLTNLDVDHRGRIWVCEVVNYRRHNGQRPEGDRILILEDTDHDGVADTVKTYYQGRDIDSAMGICVLGNKVIVSASPNVWVFTDDDGDDQPDRKELLFSKTGDPQHDHSAHSFLFGPDGKLYWNFGNTGHTVHDAQGNIIRDLAGNEVRDNGRPYRQGMPFRCNLDGSQFEVLGHNFRNNYEVTVDSFGTLWQSDNDDDGNRATRINYVMEYGNYGYVDEMTGEGWNADRTNKEAEIPLQHWHLNDPGVVPTMLITGAGSPTGITVYEADLLPEVFRNQVIHCDAGPNVVRAYPAAPEGAGYKAETVNLVVGERDRWFRPADVCVAPDGSLFVTDWYDPGVGGHNMQDLERGRLFRLAPPNTPYRTPKFDFSTPQGAVEALTNPAGSVRYMAWEAIQKFNEAAVPPLKTLAGHGNPRLRARALWALGKLPGQGSAAVATALADQDPDLRCMGIRLARQLNLPLADYAQRVVRDPSPAVRRELAIALRFDSSEAVPALWAELALQHDGRDRWYLEALGIGSDLRAAETFAAFEGRMGGNLTRAETLPTAIDIVWRSRAPRAAEWLGALLLDPVLPDQDVLRYLRALDFHPAEVRAPVLTALLAHAGDASTISAERVDLVVVESLMRLPDVDLKDQTQLLGSVERALDGIADRNRQIKILRRLKLPSAQERLLQLVRSSDPDSASVAAMEMLLRRGSEARLMELMSDPETAPEGLRLAASIGMTNFDVAAATVRSSFASESVLPDAKLEMARRLTASDPGARFLVEQARAGSLPAAARLVVGSQLRAHNNQEIRAAAQELFPAPKSAAKEALPPLAELVARKGKADAGSEVFKLKGTCANCHIVAGQGKNVGPDLSEIGGKLSREAMLVSILDPSAGISHNFEQYSALTDSGQVVNGLLVSQNPEQVVLKDAQGIERTIPKSEIEQFKKLDKSLMPENLHEALTTDELVDLLEYLMTLRKPQ
jgi:putative membrane-bound dehydrogenase-like protein